MKVINTLVGIALLGATLGLSSTPAGAVEGILLKVEVLPGYCHMQFRSMEVSYHTPTIDPNGTIIDFYGPCDHDPLGTQEVQDQRSEGFSEWDDNDGGDD